MSQTRGGSEREAYFRVPLPTIRIYNLIEILVLAHDANENVNEKLYSFQVQSESEPQQVVWKNRSKSTFLQNPSIFTILACHSTTTIFPFFIGISNIRFNYIQLDTKTNVAAKKRVCKVPPKQNAT